MSKLTKRTLSTFGTTKIAIDKFGNVILVSSARTTK